MQLIMEVGELPVGVLEFEAFVGEFLSGRFKLGFKGSDTVTQFGNITGTIFDIRLQLSYLVIQFHLLSFKIRNHGRQPFDTCFSFLDLVFKLAQLPGLVAYKSFEFGVLTVKVAIVFSGRAMPCAGLMDVIATVKAVFAIHFGKSGVQVPHVLPRLNLVLATKNLL